MDRCRRLLHHEVSMTPTRLAFAATMSLLLITFGTSTSCSNNTNSRIDDRLIVPFHTSQRSSPPETKGRLAIHLILRVGERPNTVLATVILQNLTDASKPVFPLDPVYYSIESVPSDSSEQPRSLYNMRPHNPRVLDESELVKLPSGSTLIAVFEIEPAVGSSGQEFVVSAPGHYRTKNGLVKYDFKSAPARIVSN